MRATVSCWKVFLAALVLFVSVALSTTATADDLGKLFKKTESGKSKSDDRSSNKDQGRSSPAVSPGQNDSGSGSDLSGLFRKKDGGEKPSKKPNVRPIPSPYAQRNKPQPTTNNQPEVGPGVYWVYPPDEYQVPFPGNRPKPSNNGMINLARRTGEWHTKLYFPPVQDSFRRVYPSHVYYGFYERAYVPYRTCPSVYVFYSRVPAYISTERVIYVERPIYVEVPVFIYRDAYYLERNLPSRLDATIGDIQRAWKYGSPELLRRHLRMDMFIAVYLRGKYAYSLPAEDYLSMTYDAMRNTQTVRFTFDEVRKRTSDTYVLYGQHVYKDEDGRLCTVFISYTVERMGSEWIITEVGSSPEPLLN